MQQEQVQEGPERDSEHERGEVGSERETNQAPHRSVADHGSECRDGARTARTG